MTVFRDGAFGQYLGLDEVMRLYCDIHIWNLKLYVLLFIKIKPMAFHFSTFYISTL